MNERVDANIEGDVVVPAPPPPTPRLKSISISNFRGFSGPDPVVIPLNGRNMMIYGENGAGKSTIYHALKEFFRDDDKSRAARSQRLAGFTNVYGDPLEAKPSIKLDFEDGMFPAEWTLAEHPLDAAGAARNTRITSALGRTAIFDYRSILSTSFSAQSGPVNLFRPCVEDLLGDYPARVFGRTTTLRRLWQRTQKFVSFDRHSSEVKDNIDTWCKEITRSLDEALTLLIPIVNEYLKILGWHELSLEGFEQTEVKLNKERSPKHRKLVGGIVTPIVKLVHAVSITVGEDAKDYAHTPEAHHDFLNEARLSALGLAIFLAGRDVCSATSFEGVPKFMVLDDILIGLDQSNRLPVLNLLAKKFSDWQIVLLTHDRTWFETARREHKRANASKYWEYARLHSAEDVASTPTIVRCGDSIAWEAVRDARDLLALGHIYAASNQLRIALEFALKEYSERKKVPYPLGIHEKGLTAGVLIDALKAKNQNEASWQEINQAIDFMSMYKDIFLNKASHGANIDINPSEIKGAITAMKGLLGALRLDDPNLKLSIL